jgi:hypothetical protein
VNIGDAITVYTFKNTTMKINQTIKSVFIAAAIAVAALCGTVRPAQADLTGPKPPKVSHEIPTTSAPVSPDAGETH